MSGEQLVVDDLEFELRRSSRRRSIQVTVDRGGELLLFAPDASAISDLESFVHEKRYWIYTKLTEKEALQRDCSGKEYVTGEGFPYLGRSYRLLLVDRQDVAVKLEKGRFRMRRGDADRHVLIDWYKQHAHTWLSKQVERLQSRVDVEPSRIAVRDLGYRWGSCGKDGALYFHWRSILLPSHIVQYIVAHELVHLHSPHHTPEFWNRLERAMPDFARRKQWLAENGAKLVSI